MSQKITKEDIIGSYRLPNSSPEGGQSVMIFPNGTFATFYFGGGLKGTWEIKKAQVIFTTHKENNFVLYGRKLEILKDTTQVNYGGTGNNTYINLNPDKDKTMQPIFNVNANCFDFPYYYTTTEELNSLQFGQNNDRDGSCEVYTFDIPKIYNDLIVINLPTEYTEETDFVADYRNGELFFNYGSKSASKRSLGEESQEDEEYLKTFMKQELMPDILQYGNEFFPSTDTPTKETVQPFYKINPKNISNLQTKELIINPTSLFTAICD